MESKKTNKAIFLDRDGVINKEISYAHKIESFIFIDGIFEACKFFLKLDFKIIIITNQSGISRGYYNENDYQKLNNWMLSKFIDQNVSILDVFHCPHLPESNCNCRKPKPGMFFLAEKKHKINLGKSWMIGDKETDIEAANYAGIVNTILIENSENISGKETNAKFVIKSISSSEKIISN
jgi:D-glycero-D-manno-heptose 1,7-bisphosphate phosphatase